MRITNDTRHSKARLRGLSLIVALAIAVVGWVLWRRARNAPVRAHIDQGIALLNQGQTGGAEAQWRAAVRLDPNSFEGWELLGNLYARADDCAAARPALEQAVRIEPSALTALKPLADCEFQLQDYRAAQHHARLALQGQPDDLKLLQLLAQSAEKLGDRAVRLKYLQKLVELQPQSGAALADLVAELQFRKEYDRAIPIAERLVAAQPNAASAYFSRGSVLFAAASDDAMLKRARADFQKALLLEPGDIEARRSLARSYVLLDQPRLAIEQFEEIGRGRPWVSAHLFEMAGAYRRAGDARRADETLARFTRARDFNVNALELGNSVKRRPQSAEPLLKRGVWFMDGLRENADDGPFQLYRYRYLRGEWKAVEFYLDGARQLAPDDAKVRVALRDLETLNARYLEKSRRALQSGDAKAAKNALAHALLLRPDAAETGAVRKQLEARGLDALGSLPAAAQLGAKSPQPSE